jgi:Flp pilus assembly protein TadG
MVEGMLVILPLMALVLLIVDTSWGLFVRATIQYAVQAGANYAAAGGTNGTLGQVAGIQEQVQQQASGLLNSTTINVNFYSPTTGNSLGNTTAGANQAGNMVQVNVTYPFQPLAPLFRSGLAINLSATASSILSATPAPAL